MEEKFDVIVIGAGISGLTAAHRLKQKDPNLKVLVIEAKERVGGRTFTVPLKSTSGTDHWDMGGQWVGRCQPHVMDLLAELKLETHPQYLEGTKFMQLGDNQVKTYKSDIPSLSLFALLDMHQGFTKVEKMRKTVPIDDPWKCKNAAEWDVMTLETFTKETFWTKGPSDALDAAVRCIFGAESSQMSLLFLLMYVNAAGGLKNLLEGTEYTGNEYRIAGGAQQISQKLVLGIGSENVKLSQPVSSITQVNEGVVIRTTKGTMFECQRVIIAIPPPSLAKITFQPELPIFKTELIKRMPIGCIIKVVVTYEKAFWREHGQSGEVVTSGGPSKHPECDIGPLCVIYDASSAFGSPALVAFLGGMPAVQWANLQFEERKKGVLDHLATFFGEEVFNYLQYQEKNWSAEPYTNGGPVCCASPGSMQYFAKGLREPFERIHFAGTETATTWCGYLDGAVQAGLRAAAEVLGHIRPQLITQEDFSIYQKRAGESQINTESHWLKLTLGLGVVAIAAILSWFNHS